MMLSHFFLTYSSIALVLAGCARLDRRATTTSPLPYPSPSPAPTLLSLVTTAPWPHPSPTPLPTVLMPAAPEPDFAFSFSFGACYTESLDTFQGTFTRDTSPSGPKTTIPLTLTDAQMLAIYQNMVAISFFGYPENFQIPVAEEGAYAVVTPAFNYAFAVRHGEVIRTVKWRDEIVEPDSLEAERLRELIQLIQGMLRAHPAVKQVTTPGFLCM